MPENNKSSKGKLKKHSTAYMSPTSPKVKNPQLTENEKVTFQSEVFLSSDVGPRASLGGEDKGRREARVGRMHAHKMSTPEQWTGQVDTRPQDKKLLPHNHKLW
jgi:hypothetical protein